MSKKKTVEFPDAGQRLKAARGTRSQEALAREMGVHVKTFGLYERGKLSPNLDFLIRFQKLTGVSLDLIAIGFTDGQWPLDTALLAQIIEKAEKTVPSASVADKARLISEWYMESVAARSSTLKGPL